ncbi:MAG: ATP-binding protein [Bacteroidales bacterium]|nr:MAG: ATP-binding protein [Bacteroidales bacterium]
MGKIILSNPFPVNTYYGAEYFCDRDDETARLISAIRSGNSTTLLSIRRMGKTGLIQHTLLQLPLGYKGVYVDILETENLNHFLNVLATAIINSVPEKSKLGTKVWNFIKSLRPTISFDSLTGNPQAFFDIKGKEVELSISAVLQFLESQSFKTVIAIDEFQQILKYPEQFTDAWLRSRIQQLKNVVFIFSGSQQHLMTELFTSPQRPFYRSTQIMKLGKLNGEVYGTFIRSLFRRYGKEIDQGLVDEILDWAKTHTFYVQQVCNQVFAASDKKVTHELVKAQLHLLLKEQETMFFTFRNMLTAPQWQLLKAVAHEGIVYQPTAKHFLARHHLNASATVLRSLKTLQEHELVYTDFDDEGRLYYSVYDVFFQRWAEGR